MAHMNKKERLDPELKLDKLYNDIIFSWRENKILDTTLDIDVIPKEINSTKESFGICLSAKDIDKLIKFLIKNRLHECNNHRL